MTTSQIHKIKRPILLIPQYHTLSILGGDSLSIVLLMGISCRVNTNPLINRVAALVTESGIQRPISTCAHRLKSGQCTHWRQQEAAQNCRPKRE